MPTLTQAVCGKGECREAKQGLFAFYLHKGRLDTLFFSAQKCNLVRSLFEEEWGIRGRVPEHTRAHTVSCLFFPSSK